MSEIYMKKKVFWKEEKSISNHLVVIGFIFIIGISVILINKQNHEDITGGRIDKGKDNLRSKIKILVEFLKRMNFIRNKKNSIKNIKIVNVQIIDEKFNPISQSNKYEEDYWADKFTKNLTILIFRKCRQNLLSQEIELYYNFHFNKKLSQFEIANDYADDSSRFDDSICFSSGKAHIALRTTSTPKCIEFKNLQIGKFNYGSTSINANILLKFHIFKVKNKKIHIYPVNKQLITNKHTQKYYETINGQNLLPYVDRNLVFYKDTKENKYLRICNLMPSIEGTYYENKFWLEVLWDAEIQNMICFSEFGYLA
jgi:hypothetical protein